MGDGHPEDSGVLCRARLRVRKRPTPHRILITRVNKGSNDTWQIRRSRESG
jgi:hypothetical protein